MRQELADLFQPKLWFRILAISIIAVMVLAWMIKRAVPTLEFDWATALAKSFGACFLGISLMIGLFFLIPPIININVRGVSRQHGQSVHWRVRPDIRHITVDLTEPTRPLLLVETSGKPLKAGIAHKVSTAELVTFLRKIFPELLIEEKK